MIYLVVAGGFILLLGGAELMVRGAVSLAERLKVPTLVIGMTVVAFGTSAPELLVAVSAAMEGATDVTLGDLIGSNIVNILLILGASVLAAPINVETLPSRADAAALLVATGVFVALSLDGSFARVESAALIIMFAGFIGYSFLRRHFHVVPKSADLVERCDSLRNNAWLALIMTLSGLVGLVAGGSLVVDGAVAIAVEFGVSEAVVGLTIVALGTSLPELAASLVASLRGHSGVAIGNIIGSNIFNCTGIIGIAGLISPMAVPPRMLTIDVWAMALAALLLTACIFGARRLGRVKGAVFVGGYGIYIAVIATGIGHAAG